MKRAGTFVSLNNTKKKCAFKFLAFLVYCRFFAKCKNANATPICPDGFCSRDVFAPCK